MLESVGEQLIHDQAAGHRLSHIEECRFRVYFDIYLSGVPAMHCDQILHQFFDKTAKLDSRKVRSRIQQLVNRSDGTYPDLHLQQYGLRIGMFQELRLQVEQAGNNLQIVLYPVVNLLEQSFLLRERSAKLRSFCSCSFSRRSAWCRSVMSRMILEKPTRET